ncbi:hypothetical protein SKAU_G00066630 [Synaphobranchus kaupii]|uniref:Uncharacterized protein n=1 Tax=Synaphobranchus kaupii TaxID=118154 RepID=A0A9Q1JAW8_SYNKA|nr:hypothetical protein SKAU_G00066630 [Synaphobranchus kaupii]
MQELATLVRTTSPTDNTTVKLAGNALNWLHTCMQILEEHYLESLGHLTKKLENIQLSNWLEAFQVPALFQKTPGPLPLFQFRAPLLAPLLASETRGIPLVLL